MGTDPKLEELKSAAREMIAATKFLRDPVNTVDMVKSIKRVVLAREELRRALGEPEQEPVRPWDIR